MNVKALENLNQFTGTENYYNLSPFHGKFVVTDGVRFLADNADCFWLIDILASYQPGLARHPDSRLHDMQFWKLEKHADGSATVTCVADSDEEPAVKQVIGHTDFPLDQIDIWVTASPLGMVAMLRTEY